MCYLMSDDASADTTDIMQVDNVSSKSAKGSLVKVEVVKIPILTNQPPFLRVTQHCAFRDPPAQTREETAGCSFFVSMLVGQILVQCSQHSQDISSP